MCQPAPAALNTSRRRAPSHSALEMADIPHGEPAVVATAFISLLLLPPHCIAEVIYAFRIRLKISLSDREVESKIFIKKINRFQNLTLCFLNFVFKSFKSNSTFSPLTPGPVMVSL